MAVLAALASSCLGIRTANDLVSFPKRFALLSNSVFRTLQGPAGGGVRPSWAEVRSRALHGAPVGLRTLGAGGAKV